MHGRMEGWVRIRIAGQTDWKRLWMVIIAGASDSASTRSSSPATPRKRRMSALFTGGSQDNGKQAGAHGPIMVLLASPKPKDKKKPVLTITNIRQAFAVYPERPELISRSTLMKLEGSIGEEETAAAMRGREGWLLVMPELESGNTQASEMLKWMIGGCNLRAPWSSAFMERCQQVSTTLLSFMEDQRHTHGIPAIQHQ